jgi:murein DD-endopeptidase MepM/ murein hydrolase activator NlpD
MIHNAGADTVPIYVESLYAHLDTFIVADGAEIARGQAIGTIGNANGIYAAHLHLEVRDSLGMEVGGGYSTDQTGFLDPTAFIRTHRPKK